MADLWYYEEDERKLGPFSGRQLKELATCGRILPGDTIWKEGIPSGVLARKVKYLFSPAPAGAAPGSAAVPLAKAPSSSRSPAGTPSCGDHLPAVQSATSPPSRDAKPDPVELRTGTMLEESTPGEAKVPDKQPPALLPDNMELQSAKQVPAKLIQPSSQQKQAKKGRAFVLRGAVIAGQDGFIATYQKKCTTCGHEDSCRHSMRITNGVTTATFFCPKCRKCRDVAIQCFMN